MYEIRYSDGRVETTETYSGAIRLLLDEYGESAVIGHDGDISEWGDRTLCWADEASAANDDGKNAVASIYCG